MSLRELNVSWSRELGVRLDLVRWETHAHPSFGADAQDVINEQIPDDYDIFVGIMWCRYGTPTGRAGSGTAEEFNRAKARYDEDQKSVQLMIYFKDEAIPPSHLDPTQLAKVNDFRASLGEKGGLYWLFTGIDHFEKLIRMHLTRQVQAWKSRTLNTIESKPDEELKKVPDNPTADDDDEGILDLMEVFEDKFAELGEITNRITAATEELGSKMTDRTSEMEGLPRGCTGQRQSQGGKASHCEVRIRFKSVYYST